MRVQDEALTINSACIRDSPLRTDMQRSFLDSSQHCTIKHPHTFLTWPWQHSPPNYYRNTHFFIQTNTIISHSMVTRNLATASSHFWAITSMASA